MCTGQEKEVLVISKENWKLEKNWISQATYKPLVDKFWLSGSKKFKMLFA